MTLANFNAMDATPASQPIATMGDGDNSNIFIRTSEHRKASYRYAGSFTPVASPTDVLMIQGSGTKTLRIKRIALGGVATANGNLSATLIRRSTQFTTLGSAVFTAITAGKLDNVNDAAATGVVSTIGTANLTSVGAAVANLGQGRLFLPTTGTGTPAPLVWEFATRQDKPIILRGVLDFLFINFNGSLPAGGICDYEIHTEEDAS